MKKRLLNKEVAASTAEDPVSNSLSLKSIDDVILADTLEEGKAVNSVSTPFVETNVIDSDTAGVPVKVIVAVEYPGKCDNKLYLCLCDILF